MSDDRHQPIEIGNQRFLVSMATAYDQGRACAMQRLTADECPYLRHKEQDLYDAWLRGYQSYQQPDS